MMYRLVAAAFALLVALPLAASAQQSPAPLQVPAAAVYPFTCNMSGATNALTVISGGIDKIAFAVSKGATALGLDPGQCAFNDRAVRPAEPKTLCVTGIVETNMTYKGLTVTGGGFNTTSGGNSRNSSSSGARRRS